MAKIQALLYLSRIWDKAFLPHPCPLPIILCMITRNRLLRPVFLPLLLLSLAVPLASAADGDPAEGDAATPPTETNTPAGDTAEGDTAGVGDGDGQATPASTTPIVTGPRTEPAPDLSRLQDLVRSNSPETEVVWLETDEDRTLALYHPQSQTQALGSVIIFPDEGTHADWPDTARALRLWLSDQGWHTLSVQLPTPPGTAIPKRTLPVLTVVTPPAQPAEGEEATAETTPPVVPPPTPQPEPVQEPEQPRTPYSDRLQLLGSAAVSEMKQRSNGVVVIMGIGSGAVWATQFANSVQTSEPMLGLVLLDTVQPSDPSAPDLADLFPLLQMPVLDIFQRAPGSLTAFEDEAKQRKRWARRHQLPHYYQRRLSNNNLDWEKKSVWLRQQVTGLLRRYVLERFKMQMKEEQSQNPAASEQAPGRKGPDPI